MLPTAGRGQAIRAALVVRARNVRIVIRIFLDQCANCCPQQHAAQLGKRAGVFQPLGMKDWDGLRGRIQVVTHWAMLGPQSRMGDA